MTLKIGFLAISQAHQYLHWLPAALRLARQADVEVSVLCTSRAGLEFIRSYDPQGLLRLKRLWSPSRQEDGLFTPPPRLLALLLNVCGVSRFPTLVTTETTSGLLRKIPGFPSRLVLIKHGAGDREGSYNPKHALFDLILTNGEKHRQALLERALTEPDRCVVTGNAKLELVPSPTPLFTNGKPVALYNPHFDPKLSSWFSSGRDIISAMERLPHWNFVVAPHVKLRGGPSLGADAPNILIDRGSVRSIDMSYTHAADVYIGDVSSQVYEFIQRPRPCIFLNFDSIDWKARSTYAHWRLGQVIECPDQLGAALDRSHDLQPSFYSTQEQLREYSMDRSEKSASERQADAILAFARS